MHEISSPRFRIAQHIDYNVFAIVAFLVLALLLPKGFSSDTSIIGQGSNFVILAHNKDSAQSLNLLEYMNEARSDYACKVEFVVTDTNVSEGSAFIASQKIELGTLLLFAPNGMRLNVASNLDSAFNLRFALGAAFK